MAKLYVGNLSFEATEDDLRAFFAEVGETASVTVIRDKFTNQSRGFGFVELADPSQAGKAIETLNGKPLKGRPVKVNEAKPLENRPGGGGGGGRGRRF